MVYKEKILVICGPTASGKNDLAYQILDEYEGEIINADSRQVYKHFDIGTNKGNHEILDNGKVMLEHKYIGNLYSFLEPTEDFSIYEYQKLAKEKINQLISDQKLPILLGGTGLYIDSLVKGYILDENNYSNREELNKLKLQELLKIIDTEEIDISKLNNSDRNNPVRLIRIIERSRQGNINKELTGPEFNFTIFYPDFDREELYEKINNRVEKMFDEGFIDEVKKLKKMGYEKTKPFLGIGYKEVNEYLEGSITLDEAKERMKISHRNYAKRQITWFEGEGRGYDLKRVDSKNVLEEFKNNIK